MEGLYIISSVPFSEKGKTILVVGHSNTIPTFTNRISNKNIYNDIEDNNNSNLYVVNICDGIDPQNSLFFIK